jgi:hypothetical protein
MSTYTMRAADDGKTFSFSHHVAGKLFTATRIAPGLFRITLADGTTKQHRVREHFLKDELLEAVLGPADGRTHDR